MSVSPQQVNDAVKAGRISIAEGEYYLEQEYHKPRRQRIMASIFTVVVIMLSIFALNPGSDSLSGNVILDTTQLDTTGSMTIDTPVTRITISGTLIGEGTANIWLDTPENNSLLIASTNSDDGTPRTDKAGYLTGEIITIEHAPNDATYYLDDGSTSTAVLPPFSAPESDATLLVVTTTEEGIVTYRLPIRIGTYERETTFNNLCTETCAIQATTGTLRVETSEGATLRITEIYADIQTPNNPPTQTQQLPALSITETATLDLAPFFEDQDGDTILYSTGTSEIATLTVDGSTLTITPTTDGTEIIQVYASDLQELITTTLELTVTMPVIETPTTNETNITETNTTNETINTPPTDIPTNETNTTTETPSNETNTTINTTTETITNQTNTTINASIDCNDPNPNNRPLECLLSDEMNYFPDQDIYWYNDARESMARRSSQATLISKGRKMLYTSARERPQ